MLINNCVYLIGHCRYSSDNCPGETSRKVCINMLFKVKEILYNIPNEYFEQIDPNFNKLFIQDQCLLFAQRINFLLTGKYMTRNINESYISPKQVFHLFEKLVGVPRGATKYSDRWNKYKENIHLIIEEIIGLIHLKEAYTGPLKYWGEQIDFDSFIQFHHDNISYKQ